MYYDKFDIVEAHYCFCCDFYNGQACPLYAKQCRIRRYYTPSPLFNGFDSLSDNGKEIYRALCQKYKFNTKYTNKFKRRAAQLSIQMMGAK